MYVSHCTQAELTFITTISECSFVFVEYANHALRELNLWWKKKEIKREKDNNRIHQEINVLLIMFKTVYDKANLALFHKMNTRE